MENDLGLPARFWVKVNKDGPIHPYNPELGKCWVWTAGHTKGYGRFEIRKDDDSWTSALAHRLTLAVKLGRPIASGLEAEHSCDNPPCVNPDHLSEGTRQDNMTDMTNKKRQFRGHDRSLFEHNQGLRADNKSGHKGVWWDKERCKWRAKIVNNSQQKCLGQFDSLEEAIAARKAGEKKYWK